MGEPFLPKGHHVATCSLYLSEVMLETDTEDPAIMKDLVAMMRGDEPRLGGSKFCMWKKKGICIKHQDLENHGESKQSQSTPMGSPWVLKLDLCSLESRLVNPWVLVALHVLHVLHVLQSIWNTLNEGLCILQTSPFTWGTSKEWTHFAGCWTSKLKDLLTVIETHECCTNPRVTSC